VSFVPGSTIVVIAFVYENTRVCIGMERWLAAGLVVGNRRRRHDWRWRWNEWFWHRNVALAFVGLFEIVVRALFEIAVRAHRETATLHARRRQLQQLEASIFLFASDSPRCHKTQALFCF